MITVTVSKIQARWKGVGYKRQSFRDAETDVNWDSLEIAHSPWIKLSNSSSKARSASRTSAVRSRILMDSAIPLSRGIGLYIAECSTSQKSPVSIDTIWYSPMIFSVAWQKPWYLKASGSPLSPRTGSGVQEEKKVCKCESISARRFLGNARTRTPARSRRL